MTNIELYGYMDLINIDCCKKSNTTTHFLFFIDYDSQSYLSQKPETFLLKLYLYL